jgi:hypothetical protein
MRVFVDLQAEKAVKGPLLLVDVVADDEGRFEGHNLGLKIF